MAELKAAVPNLPDGAVWDDGKNGVVLRVLARPGAPHTSITFRLPFTAPVETMHAQLAITARNLVCGKQEWDDGRVLLQWLTDGENGASDIDAIASARGNEHKKKISLVTKSSSGAGYPALIIQNLAASGEMTVSGLALTPVRHRAVWKWARWVLTACWFSWFLALLSNLPFLRRAAAASLWLVMGVLFAFPGPWERLSPMLIPYDLGNASEIRVGAAAVKSLSPETKTPQGKSSQGAHGEIPDQGGWIIQVRSHLKKHRLLLHFGFVVGITILFACLVGLKHAAWLTAGLIIAMEGAQAGFGYGFDVDDFLDLVCGAAGIVLGLVVFGKLCRWHFFSKWMVLPSTELTTPAIADCAPNEREA